MPHACFSISLPDHSWVHTVSTQYPDVELRVFSVTTQDSIGIALIEILGGSLQNMLDSLQANPQLHSVELLDESSDRVLIRLETPAPFLALAAQSAGTPIDFPITIQNGIAAIDIRASHKAISEMASAFRKANLPFSVDAINSSTLRKELLTDTQQDIILTAVERGYYDTPRRCTLTELADTIGVAKSTCSETLHRAEETIIKEFVQRHLRQTDPGPIQAD